MRIEYAIPAKYAEVNDNQATIIGAGIDTYSVAVLPTVLNVMLAIRVVGQVEEFPGQHHLKCQVRNTAGEVVGPELDAELGLETNPGARPNQEWLQNLMFAVAIQFEASTAETYTITVMFDDAEHAVPIHVVLIPTQ